MLLKLHKEIPQTESGSRWQRSKDAVSGRAFITPSHQLNSILKKHGRVSVKNYGSIHETLCQDLHLSVGSDCTFSSEDDSALKLTMLNACSSTFWVSSLHRHKTYELYWVTQSEKLAADVSEDS